MPGSRFRDNKPSTILNDGAALRGIGYPARLVEPRRLTAGNVTPIEERSDAFADALSATRRHTLALICAIGTLRFLDAWWERCELLRVIARAEERADAIPASPERDNAIQRLNAVKAIALPMLELVPTPSARALQQAPRDAADESGPAGSASTVET